MIYGAVSPGVQQGYLSMGYELGTPIMEESIKLDT